ncbi:actinorhodin polyketide dimerase [Micromonospora endophytica]|uniref:Actinorhodin polyketide dimerase n=1 Tax=Micromonospora endophytica TaxID=515350 RepID=A0A2W2C750_9ACTN|nr:actinorhodin polyketide dimerase [Micromonospora endophytica]RIW42665.1 flavin reductase family protein [Micromonospora endophytica]
MPIPPDLWKRLTSTVGLVTVRDGERVNIMSAEWSYFVNKQPLWVAVVLGPRSATRELIGPAGEFCLTLCAEDQAALADLAGSFSIRDLDKTSSELVSLAAARLVSVPWVDGGVVALECQLRQEIAFPVHRMFVGEVVAAHLPERPDSVRPLVKHGGMYQLGERAERREVAVVAQRGPAGTVRVGATSPAKLTAPFRITLALADGGSIPLGEFAANRHGDLQIEVPLPAAVAGLRPGPVEVVVERDGARPGRARLTEESGWR